MNTKEKYIKINKILAEWNPFEVPENIALDEYSGYIPSIVNALKVGEHELILMLRKIAGDLGSGFNSENDNHLEDINKLAKSIIETLEL